MTCPACSRRALGLFIESTSGLNTTTILRSRRLPSNNAPPPLRQQQQTRLRAFSARPALRTPDAFRLPDIRQTDGAGADQNASQDAAIVPSNINPEPRAPTAQLRDDAEDTIAAGDGAHSAGSVDAAADPDPSELRKDVGLGSDNVQHQLWDLTGGVSGTRPPWDKKEKKDKKKKNKREGDEENAVSSGDQSGKKNKKVAEIFLQGGVPKVAAHEDVRRKTWGNDKKKRMLPWQVQKEALKEKFGDEGWQPRKKLSPDAMDGIRTLHQSDPELYTTPVLANEFKVSPEAIRRILRSKWRPEDEEQEERAQRWEKRGEKIWEMQVEKGIKPPKKWRVKGIGSVHGGKDTVPRWKQKRGRNGEGQYGQYEPRNRVSEFARPRGPGANYGDEGGWNDRIL
ncbi:Neugrin-related protein [Lasiodiplodia theobromae]|uniref:Neugrin-related protein n=1 Tax=Lasiodiplodia theobromae TaxID=45133 RepID=UPI0015C309BA|nr:Neugrin-related protein [Lasiodiplodia theobromae]KAF4542967.1 Neugrin-related protein [Lasiodiplodia theobromae]